MALKQQIHRTKSNTNNGLAEHQHIASREQAFDSTVRQSSAKVVFDRNR